MRNCIVVVIASLCVGAALAQSKPPGSPSLDAITFELLWPPNKRAFADANNLASLGTDGRN